MAIAMRQRARDLRICPRSGREMPLGWVQYGKNMRRIDTMGEVFALDMSIPLLRTRYIHTRTDR